MSTFSDISKTLKRALISSPLATLHSYHNGNISLPGFGLTATFDFINNFDWDTHPAEQFSQSVASAVVGMFLPHILTNLADSYVGDPQVSLMLALTMTTVALKYGIDICDKLTQTDNENIPASKVITVSEYRILRDKEILRLQQSLNDSEFHEEKEDKRLDEIFRMLKT